MFLRRIHQQSRGVMRHAYSRALFFTVTTMLSALVPVVGPASAEPFPVASDSFYSPPNPLPTHANGDLIRSESVPLLAGLVSLPVTATRIMYQSTDTAERPVATTGMVLTPSASWPGPGPRPLISFAIGTHGAGDACAPSKLLTEGMTLDGSSAPFAELQSADLAAPLARGYAVAVTDYQGLGTPGGHGYLQGLPEGRAVLDAARAAIRLGVAAPDAPIGIYGTSQGGNSAAGAAELAESYAPELAIAGTVAVEPPVDPAQTMEFNDGKALVGVTGFFINGVIATHPELEPRITRLLNSEGKKFLRATAGQCTIGIARDWAFRRTSDFTTTGRPIIETLRTDPEIKTALDSMILGATAPADPVMIIQNTNDDVVPVGPVRQLAAEWCGQGANVTYNASFDTPPLLPQVGFFGHSVGLFTADQSMQWLNDRFAGMPTQPTCG